MTTLDDGWITLATAPRKPHEQEHAQAWIDRLLGIAPVASRSLRIREDRTVEVRVDDGPIVQAVLSPNRVEVLRSLTQRALGLAHNPGWQRGDGGAVVLCDEARSHFLITRKDGGHPNPRCRGKLALLSGALERGESFREGALRELHEEVRDLAIVDSASALLMPLTTATLAAVQWPGAYRLGVFVAAAPTAVFARWRTAWNDPAVLSEATPVCLDRATLLALIADEEARPGTHFVASHHVLKLAL